MCFVLVEIAPPPPYREGANTLVPLPALAFWLTGCGRHRYQTLSDRGRDYFRDWDFFSRLPGRTDGTQASAEHTRFVSEYSPQRKMSHHDLSPQRGEIRGQNPLLRQ